MQQQNDTVALAGYTDRLSLRAGETIGFKVSSKLSGDYSAWLSRSIGADPNPEGIGIVEEPVEDAIFPKQTLRSRHQLFHPGSYALTHKPVDLSFFNGFAITATIFPTLEKNSPQTILSLDGIRLFLDESGCVAVQLRDVFLGLSTPLELRQWVRLEATYDADLNCLRIKQTPLSRSGTALESSISKLDLSSDAVESKVAIAANWNNGQASDFFNGKIQNPGLYRSNQISDENIVALWDFAINTSSTTVADTGADHLDAELINFPARAMTGSQWDASEMCWRQAPEHYNAIHFHEDDIYDFGWETDFTFTVPNELPSGIYVMHIKSGEHEDAMPFYVCAPRGKPKAKVCVLIPTFTYVVYGNHARPDYEASWQCRIADWGAYPNNPAEHPNYGLSTYNFHSDGSGICQALV